VHRLGVLSTVKEAPLFAPGLLRRCAPRNEPGGAIQILVERGGNRELVELPSALDEPRRLGVHAAGPDRRGTGRGRSKRWKGARNGGRGVPAVRGASAASDSP